MYYRFKEIYRSSFPAKSSQDVPRQLNQILTHASFIAPAWRLARTLADHGESALYMYHFTRVNPGCKAAGVGAAHGVEIFYVFGSGSDTMAFTEADRALSRTMRQT